MDLSFIDKTLSHFGLGKANDIGSSSTAKNITIITFVRAKPEKVEQVQAELEKLAPITRAEKGCIRYEINKDNESESDFVIYQSWESRELWQIHQESKHKKAYMDATDHSVREYATSELTRIA